MATSTQWVWQSPTMAWPGFRDSPALEGVPVGHQLLQAFLVFEDGRQLLLRVGTGRVQGPGWVGQGEQEVREAGAAGQGHLAQPAERLQDISL